MDVLLQQVVITSPTLGHIDHPLNSDGSVFAVDIETGRGTTINCFSPGYDGEFDRFNIIELSETRLQFSGTYFEEYVDEAGQRQKFRLQPLLVFVNKTNGFEIKTLGGQVFCTGWESNPHPKNWI